MSPPRKIQKTNEDIAKNTPDGEIKFEVDEVSKMEEYDGGNDRCKYSPTVEVGGVRWKLNIWKSSGDLKATVHCMVGDQLSPWRIDGKAEFTLVNSVCRKNITVEANDTLCKVKKTWTKILLDCKTLIDGMKGFIKNDKITVEVRFWTSNMKGIKSYPRFNFTDSDDSFHNVALVIEGQKIYVNKEILAIQSPVFKAMFFGDFAEKNKQEIEMNDIDRKEFTEMLHVIYPSSCKKITDASAEYLLKLGDRFQITSMIDRTENFLIDSENISNIDKLRIADKYNLSGLKEHCISELKTAMDFKEIQESPVFNEISDATARLLFNKIAQIAK